MSNKMIKDKKTNFNGISVDTGVSEVPIKDRNGNLIGTIYVNPTDTNIVDRLEETIEFFKNYKVPTGFDGFRKAEKEVTDRLSYILNTDASVFFKAVGPFTPLKSGELYFENVLNAVAGLIKKEMKFRTNKVQRRANKYTAKYHN